MRKSLPLTVNSPLARRRSVPFFDAKPFEACLHKEDLQRLCLIETLFYHHIGTRRIFDADPFRGWLFWKCPSIPGKGSNLVLLSSPPFSSPLSHPPKTRPQPGFVSFSYVTTRCEHFLFHGQSTDSLLAAFRPIHNSITFLTL